MGSGPIRNTVLCFLFPLNDPESTDLEFHGTGNRNYEKIKLNNPVCAQERTELTPPLLRMEYLASYEGKSSNFCRSDRISHLSVPVTKRSKEWTPSWLSRWWMEEAAYRSMSVSGLSLNTRYLDMAAVYTAPLWSVINIKPMLWNICLDHWMIYLLQLKAAIQLICKSLHRFQTIVCPKHKADV